MYKVIEDVVSVDDFLRLRKIIGLTPRPKTAAAKALPMSLFGVHVMFDEATVGMGRVVGDDALNFEIVDMAVDPAQQGKGFGRMMMERIMAYLEQEAPKGAYITLMADVPEFYAKFGLR